MRLAGIGPVVAPYVARFDHAVIAVRDLGGGVERYRALGFGVALGGRHDGLGTENAIIRFGADYVELLSVYDEAAALSASRDRRALVELIRRTLGAAGFAGCRCGSG